MPVRDLPAAWQGRADRVRRQIHDGELKPSAALPYVWAVEECARDLRDALQREGAET